MFKFNYSSVISKSKWRIIFGLITISIAIGFALSIKPLTLLQVLYSLYFTLLGVIFVFHGLGKDPLILLGQNFIYINDEKIEYKPNRLHKSKVILWNRINTVKIKTASIQLKSFSDESINIEYNHMEYSTIQKLKACIKTYAIEKNINFSE